MKLTGRRNQCGNCTHYFNSLTAFDKHRTGKHGVNRRCLNTDEMFAQGMMINSDGFWVTEAMKRKFEDEDKTTENDATVVER